MLELTLLVAFAGVCWFWYATMSARERAITAGRKSCIDHGLQLLDDTVALSRLRLARDGSGRLVLARTYRFEFSDTGDNRRTGEIVLVGGRVESTLLDPFRTEDPVVRRGPWG